LIDFWTGEKHNGGQKISKKTPLDIMPLYVKAGSVLPFGPKVQYSSEKKWDNLEIRIYEGANGEFTLYEDENDNYNYEKGAYSTITFTWDDAKKNTDHR
jgi:alpha-D-xyloside xylohydrolase